jgi:hypothetical protein
MLEALDVDANSTDRLLDAIRHAYNGKRRIHLFLDNARYHNANAILGFLCTDMRQKWDTFRD